MLNGSIGDQEARKSIPQKKNSEVSDVVTSKSCDSKITQEASRATIIYLKAPRVQIRKRHYTRQVIP